MNYGKFNIMTFISIYANSYTGEFVLKHVLLVF